MIFIYPQFTERSKPKKVLHHSIIYRTESDCRKVTISVTICFFFYYILRKKGYSRSSDRVRHAYFSWGLYF